MPAGDIEIDFKGVLLASIIETGRRNAFPVEAYARHLGQFDAHQDGVPRDAAVEALVKIDRDAEDDECHRCTRYEKPPAHQQIGQHAQQRAAKENAHPRPAEPVAASVQNVLYSLQSLNLSFDSL